MRLWVFSAPIFLLLISCQSIFFPKDNSLVERGNNFARDGLYREAVSTYTIALKQDPQNYAIRRNLGIVFSKLGEYSKSESFLRTALSEYPDDFETNFYLAESTRARGKYAEAIYRYNRALDIKPNNIKALRSLAWVYFTIRFYGEAERLAKNVLRRSPNDSQTTIIAARVMLKIGKFNQGLRLIGNSKRRFSKQDVAFLTSVEGDIFFKLGKLQRAEKSYKAALREKPLLAGALLGLGKIEIARKGTMAKAVDLIERAVKIKPNLKEGLYILARYYMMKNDVKYRPYHLKFRKLAATDPEFQNHLIQLSKLAKSKS